MTFTFYTYGLDRYKDIREQVNHKHRCTRCEIRAFYKKGRCFHCPIRGMKCIVPYKKET